MKRNFANHQAISFVVLTYAISWTCWIPILSFINADLYSSPLVVIVMLFFGGLSPTLSALIITYTLHGKKGVKGLVAKLFIFKVAPKWYSIALLTGPLLIAMAVFYYLYTGGEVGWVNYQVFLFLPVFFIIASVLGPLTEELGWRGFLLPEVSKANGFIKTAIIIGLIHTIWHAPLFWAAEGTSISGMPVTILSVGKYAVFVVGTSFIYTWVVLNARGSVFLAIVLHSGINGSHQALNYLFPNIENKLAIWNIEVGIYAVVIVSIVMYSVVTKYIYKETALPAERP